MGERAPGDSEGARRGGNADAALAAVLELAEALTRAPTADDVATHLDQAARVLLGARTALLCWEADDGLLVRLGAPRHAVAISAPLAPGTVDALVRRPGPQPLQPGRAGVLGAVGRAAGIDDGTLVPLVAGGALVGALVVARPAAGADPDGGRLSGLAALATTGLESALLLQRLHHQAEHDPLTGLPTLRLVERFGLAGLADARRRGAPVVVLFVDLDGFRSVNDQLGHSAGDRLLVQAANRLRTVVRGADTVGRVGGDEFAVVLTQVGHLAGAQAVAERIVRSLAEPFALDGVTVTVGASVGVALSTLEDLSLAGPLARADAAMERAKRAGRGRVAIDQGAVVVPGLARFEATTTGAGDAVDAATQRPPA